jgi:tetrahedral aminopeptidase
MIDPVPFLLSLLSKPGLSGFEGPVRELIIEKWRPLTDEISVNKLGSLHALKRAAKPGKHPSIMVATHMDGIGLMVKKIENGFLLVTKMGGVDPRIFPGQLVTVHGKRDIPGLVQMIPDRLQVESLVGNPPSLKTLFVDTGLKESELDKLVSTGDIISFAQEPFEMGGGLIAGHSLDNRASVAALTVCLDELKNFNLPWDVWGVATVKEETMAQGAGSSAFEIRPDLAVTIDVTFAKGPGSADYHTFGMGKGLTIGVGANIHPGLVKDFKRIAADLEIPYEIEIMPASSGTDGMPIQVTAEGIPNEVLGIPLRYMHTSLELVSSQDILRTGRLLARFIMELTPDYVSTLIEEKTE